MLMFKQPYLTITETKQENDVHAGNPFEILVFPNSRYSVQDIAIKIIESVSCDATF